MPAPQAVRNDAIPDHAVITIVRPCPRADWDKRAIMEYEVYKPGMTVAEYYMTCQQLPFSSALRAKYNVRWDIARGNIVINY